MDSKLLATIIAIAKKEAGGQARDLSLLEQKVEAKLQEFHKRSPILDLPSFSVKDGCLHCTWSSGLVLDFGNIVGPQGSQGIQGVQGPQGVAGKDGASGKDGINGKDGRNGLDGAASAAGRDGVDGKEGLTGAVGPRGEPGQDGKQGEAGKDGKDAERGPQGLPGEDGLDGEDGVGVEKAYVDDNHHLTIKLTSGKVIDAGYVRGPSGASAGKGGRVTGGYAGGGSGSNFYVTGAAYNSEHELVITNSNGSSINAGSDRQRQVKTYQFELDNFKKGNTAPATEYVGTAPRVTTLKFDNLLQRVGFTFMVPLDWDATSDMQFMAMTAIPVGVTHNVGDIINLRVESRVTRHNGITKLDDVGRVNTTQTTSTTSPYYDAANYNVMLAGANTAYHTYMPSVIIPVADIGGVGAVLYAEVGLNSISAGSVPSMLLYQLHLNYWGLPQ